MVLCALCSDAAGPLEESFSLGTVTAVPHITPPTTSVPAHVHEEPAIAVSSIRALPDSYQFF